MPTKISVLIPDDEALRFESYCTDLGHKKSTLIVRLIKEHLDKENYPFQGSLLTGSSQRTQLKTSGKEQKND